MQNNQNTNIEHIIAKIDNDFNIDHSDWIPRVAAWVIEALSILKCTQTEYKVKKLPVEDNIAYSTCELDFSIIKVYDENGCEIENLKDKIGCGCIPSTGNLKLSNTVGRDEQVAIPEDPSNVAGNYITTSKRKIYNKNKYYVPISKNKIELNFNANFIYIKYKAIKTYHSNTYGCDLPMIPNNGLLIEAIGYYCMYKILCRGYKHPVFNLSASQYGTNPYYMWNTLKDQAKRSVILDEQGEVVNDGGEWKNAFVDFTFNPKG